MASPVTLAEVRLVDAYRHAAVGAERSEIIHRYADINGLSLGRAEDALDLWAHILENHCGRGRS